MSMWAMQRSLMAHMKALRSDRTYVRPSVYPALIRISDRPSYSVIESQCGEAAGRVLPLWIVLYTHAPRAIVGGLFTPNTAMVMFGQLRMASLVRIPRDAPSRLLVP